MPPTTMTNEGDSITWCHAHSRGVGPRNQADGPGIGAAPSPGQARYRMTARPTEARLVAGRGRMCEAARTIQGDRREARCQWDGGPDKWCARRKSKKVEADPAATVDRR